MAEIFLARHAGIEGFERLLVIKRILPAYAQDERFIEMFMAEARIAAQLNHQNIAQVYNFGHIDGRYFIAMEYVHGMSLIRLMERARHQDHPLPLAVALVICDGIAAALRCAHGKRGLDGKPLGVVHRDVSPHNVMISFEGEIKLVDFGVAKARLERRHRTSPGMVKGKYAYMAPEQLLGRHIDQRADLFSLGAILYELVAGERCFRGQTDLETMQHVLEREPDARTHRPDLPPALIRLIERCLAKQPENRYESVEALESDLLAAAVACGWVGGSSLLRRFVRGLAPGETDLPRLLLRRLGDCETREPSFRVPLPLAPTPSITQTSYAGQSSFGQSSLPIPPPRPRNSTLPAVPEPSFSYSEPSGP
jgi:serine/threonine-protein kinase